MLTFQAHTDTYTFCGPATRFDFEIDVTLPQVKVVNHWASFL